MHNLIKMTTASKAELSLIKSYPMCRAFRRDRPLAGRSSGRNIHRL